MKGKKIFVSGGAGVIGLEMIPKLLARGATILVGDIKPRPSGFPPEVIYRQGDLNYLREQELIQFKPEIFIHLAATFERSMESYGFFQENFWNNVNLSHHLMTITKDLSSLKRVVFASSYLIYQPNLYQFHAPRKVAVALRETDPIQPRNLIGMAKLAHEIELDFINKFRNGQFSTVCARIFRGYGRNSRDIISRWIRALIDDQTLTIYRPEGLFDYIYAADSAEGLIRLAETHNINGIINLGTGQARRVQEVLDILQQHFPNMRVNNATSDILFEASQAEMSRFKSMLDWTPEYKLEQAIPEIIDFERTQRKLPINSSAPLTILVSSASKKVSLIQAMKTAARKIDTNAQVIAGDCSPNALSSYVADKFWVMPKTTDDEIENIINGCIERGISVILPTRDGELQYWAKHKNRLAKLGIQVIVSSPTSLINCIDKQEFSNFGRVHGLPIVPSTSTIDDLQCSRFVVKERYGAGSRSIGIDLDRKQAMHHAATLSNPIFQPFIAGHEFSIDSWTDSHSEVKALVLRHRKTIVDGESQVTKTFTHPEFESISHKIIKRLKLSGPSVLQAIEDNNGNMHVIESNARFGGASTAGINAGVDSLFWSLLEARGIDVANYPFLRISGEIQQVRLPSDIYIYDDSNL